MKNTSLSSSRQNVLCTLSTLKHIHRYFYLKKYSRFLLCRCFTYKLWPNYSLLYMSGFCLQASLKMKNHILIRTIRFYFSALFFVQCCVFCHLYLRPLMGKHRFAARNLKKPLPILTASCYTIQQSTIG